MTTPTTERVRDVMVSRPDARAWLDAHDARRLVDMDPDGSTLCGLRCLTRDRTGFCTD